MDGRQPGGLRMTKKSKKSIFPKHHQMSSNARKRCGMHQNVEFETPKAFDGPRQGVPGPSFNITVSSNLVLLDWPSRGWTLDVDKLKLFDFSETSPNATKWLKTM